MIDMLNYVSVMRSLTAILPLLITIIVSSSILALLSRGMGQMWRDPHSQSTTTRIIQLNGMS